MSNERELLYSNFASHVRSELRPEDLSTAAELLQHTKETRHLLQNLANPKPCDDEETRAVIEDLIDDIDIRKLNQLFHTPENILPCDMKYDEKAAEEAWEYFRKNTADSLSVPNASNVTHASAKFDSIEDFDVWRDTFRTMNPTTGLSFDSKRKPLKDQKLELATEIEQCMGAMRLFETKFSSVVTEIPSVPNRLNDDVHTKLKEVSKLVDTIDEFTKAKTCIIESGNRIIESPKSLPASRTNQDIEEITCQIENLAHQNTCDD